MSNIILRFWSSNQILKQIEVKSASIRNLWFSDFQKNPHFNHFTRILLYKNYLLDRVARFWDMVLNTVWPRQFFLFVHTFWPGSSVHLDSDNVDHLVWLAVKPQLLLISISLLVQSPGELESPGFLAPLKQLALIIVRPQILFPVSTKPRRDDGKLQQLVWSTLHARKFCALTMGFNHSFLRSLLHLLLCGTRTKSISISTRWLVLVDPFQSKSIPSLVMDQCCPCRFQLPVQIV